MGERKSARLEEKRPARRERDDYEEPADEEDAWQEDDAEEAEYDGGAAAETSADSQPDVLLDVPTLKVEEIDLEVEDLNARVSLQAEVLSLLKLHVGADVSLGRVSLDIKGVEAIAQLKVRLDKVAAILGRVMTTIDNNPEILSDLTRGLGSAAGEVGKGAGEAVGEVGRGAGDAAGEIGKGAGRAAGEVGKGAGKAAGEVGKGAGKAAGEVGEGAGQAVGEVGEGAGSAAESVGDSAGEAAGEIGKSAGRTAGNVVDEAEDMGDDMLRSGREAVGSEEEEEEEEEPERPSERAAARGEGDRLGRPPPSSDKRPQRRVRRQEPSATTRGRMVRHVRRSRHD